MTVVLLPKLVAPPSVPTPPGFVPSSDEWVTTGELAGCVACDTCVDLSVVTAAVAEQMFALTAYRFGTRRHLIRPHRVIQTGAAWTAYAGGWGWAHEASYLGWGACNDDIELSGPVVTIHEVKLDGGVVDPAEYALHDGMTLRRLSPNGHTIGWPDDQDVGAADTEIGTFSVDYTWGTPVPAAGRLAARTWACQLARAGAGEDCALPDNVQSAVRQGVAQKFIDPMQLLDKGYTGIATVDRWIKTVNPARATKPATCMSPDTMQGAVIYDG